ncbi:hypothetical protein D3C76_969670 [compost metagenome]
MHAGFDDVVTGQGRHRDTDDILQAQLPGKGAVVGLDALEHLPGVADHVQLVHRHHHLTDADQRHQVTVTSGLGEQALARIDQQYRDIRGGSAGDHVAGVLLVARSVGDNELALVGGEEAVRHINGDALLALGSQAINQ